MDIISLILALSSSSSQDFNYNDLSGLPTINGEILKGDIILPDLDKYIKVATKDENGNLDFNNLIENTWYILPIGEKLGRYKDGIFITDEFKDYNMSEGSATKQRLNTIRIVSFSNIHDTSYRYCYGKMFWIAPNASTSETSNIATGFMFGKGLSSNYPDSIPNLEARSISGLATFEQISRLNQTITGTKTFKALPKSTEVPTEESHLVNKKYVDDIFNTYNVNIENRLSNLTTPSDTQGGE